MALGRVRDQRTFRALRRAGTRGRSGPVAVIALVDTDGAPDRPAEVRAAFAVGRRVGPAVVRNRVRRRLRAIVGGLGLAPGAYLVTASPEAATASYEDLQRHAGLAAAQAGGKS